MAEHILGMGARESFCEIIALAEEQIAKIEGFPRRLLARAVGIELVADRQEYTGPFTTYIIRLASTVKAAADAQAAVEPHKDICGCSTQNERLVLTVPRQGAAVDPERVREVVDALSKPLVIPEVWRVHGEGFRIDPISVELLFQAMIERRASDVHLAPGMTPVFRVDNETQTSDLLGVLSSVQILNMIRDITSDEEWKEFEAAKQISFNFHQIGLGYSRVSAFIKGGAPHCTFRFLPETIPSFEDLNVPADTMKQLASYHHGLVLVTGMTGSGKSTTVAALVDWINSTSTLHILTIENPIEYVHRNKKSIISQRNTGKDVRTFGEAVTGALRHDPDVIVIGEMRDPDTIRSAINAAATGHLVISTLHSNTASEVVNRIVSFFDPVERDLVKLQLRDAMRCVICQRLVPRIGGGRVPTLEFLFNDIKAINDGILDGDTDAIRIGMQQSVSHSMLFEENLFRLYKSGIVSLEQARAHCTSVSIFDQMVMGTYSVPRLDTIKALRDTTGKH